MEQRDRRYRAHRFVALRVNVLWSWLLLTPVVLWSAVLGMAALVVALVWAGTLGARSADAWSSERARGLSGRAAASAAGWWQAATVLVLAVAATVLAGLALRELFPVGDWLDADGIARPVVGALSLVLGAAIPGVAAVVVAFRSRALEGAVVGEGELPERRARAGLVGVRRTAALAVAAALGVVNVAVLTSVTSLGEWVGAGAGQTTAAVAVLALALATPTAAVWYARRPGGPW